ncbi:unnamed protein product, partial [Brenthis ino]
MYFLSHTLRVCYFSILLELLHGYLLFAANLEDFHTIAKKLVPAQFVDSLAKIAANPSPRDRDYDYEDANKYEKQHEINDKKNNKHIQSGQKGFKFSKIRLDNDATIDFEELVERVKKRLEKELREKYSKYKQTKFNNFEKRRETTKAEIDYINSQKQTQQESHERSEYIEEMTDRPTKRDSNVHITVNTEKYEYADALKTTYNKNKRIHKDKINAKHEKDYDEFKKIEMMEKGSYEDYEPPVKDANVYSSNENKRFKIKQSLKFSKNPPKPKIFEDRPIIEEKSKINKPNYDDDEIEEVKARTENIADDDISTEKSNVKKKSHLSTFIPTRERYTMITPNYVSPKPAERYDFDEPLPEKDREREHLKYFGNPPAKINKKVRLI